MTNRELEILEILKKDPLISQEDLADKLSISRSGVATHIHNLIKKGYIKGKGYILNNPNFVTVIGGNNIDILGIPNQELISGNSNPGKIYHTFGGAARNIACALAKLEVQSKFITVYGNDLNGEKFINNCKMNNIDTEYCVKFNDEHTSSFVYIDDQNGQKFIGINDMDIYNKISPSFISNYLSTINSSLYCILDTNIQGETFKYIYKNVNVPIIVKTTSIQKNYRLIQGNQHIFALITTPLELKELLNYYNHPFTTIEEAMKFLTKHRIENIILFSAKDGLYFLNEKTSFKYKKSISKIQNVAGSCATLTSVIVWGLINNLSWQRTLKYGYAGVQQCLKSKKTINPDLSVENVIQAEQKLFE